MSKLRAAIIGIWKAEQAIAELEKLKEVNLALIQQHRQIIETELKPYTLKHGQAHHVKVYDKVVIIGSNGLILQVDDLIYTE